MKILVTGGAGFIGSEFVRQSVMKNYKVIVIDSLTYAGDTSRLQEVIKDIKFYKTDIKDKNSLINIFKKEKPKIIIHWAAESHVDRSILNATPFLQTNIIGTQILLDLSKEYRTERFINISTDEVYGELGNKGHFFEDSPLNPNSPYSVSKASADMLGRSYYRTYGLPVITVRPCNNYGPWQYPEKLIPVVILKAINNEKVPVYAKGENVREWLYVSDCADAVIKIMEKGLDGEIYNVGSGEEKKNIEVVKEILSILNIPDDIIEFIKDRPGHDFRYSLNSSKIKKQIGWEKNINFREGIKKTVNWYLDNIKWLNEKTKYLKEYWQKVYGR